MLLNDWHDDHGGMRVCLKFSSGSTSKCQFHRLLLWIVSQHTKANFHRRSPSSSSSPMSNYHHQCQTMAWPQSLLLSPSSDTCHLISPALSAKLFPIAFRYGFFDWSTYSCFALDWPFRRLLSENSCNQPSFPNMSVQNWIISALNMLYGGTSTAIRRLNRGSRYAICMRQLSMSAYISVRIFFLSCNSGL